FQAGGTFAVGAVPSGLAAGDFDRDRDLDLAVANTNTLSNSVSVLLGYGDGTFPAPRSYAVSNHPDALAVGDFNEDGLGDLAVVNYHGDNGDGTIGNVSVLLPRGDGTFQTVVHYAVGSYANAVAVGDFNRDGHQDLAVTRSLAVVVLLGRGDGTFGPGAF